MYSSGHNSEVTIPSAPHIRFLGRNPRSIDAVMREASAPAERRRALGIAEQIITSVSIAIITRTELRRCCHWICLKLYQLEARSLRTTAAKTSFGIVSRNGDVSVKQHAHIGQFFWHDDWEP